MKSKTKKILAGVGLGIIGMGCLTGCSLTDDQMGAIDKVVDKTDLLIDLMEKSNGKLNYEEACRLFKYARQRLTLNLDNVWDNIAVTQEITSNEKYPGTDSSFVEYKANSHFYKFNDGKRVIYGISNSGDEELVEGLYMSEVEVDAEGETEPESGGGMELVQTITFTSVAQNVQTNMFKTMDFDANDIVDCKIDENGIYSIVVTTTMTDDETDYVVVIDMKISQDGYLLGYTMNASSLMNVDSKYSSVITSCKVTYEYGALTDDVVESYVAKYNAQKQSQE